MTEPIVKYQSKSGVDINLTFNTVRQYLVQGKAELVTPGEMMVFMGVCKERGLNPFARDCWLIKYTANDPAAIVTSIDFFRSRAKAQEDCRGWSKGIIVKCKDGSIKRTKGLILEGEELLGGWFSAQPENWTEPFELEVNLKGYIKKTSDGKITRFWQSDNQPTMIAKIAESQGLRTIWPDEFKTIYSEDEIQSGLKPEIIDLEAITEEHGEGTASFDELAAEIEDKELLEGFVSRVAEANKSTPEAIKTSAAGRWPEFKAQFEKWVADQPPKESDKKNEPPKKDEPQEPVPMINDQQAGTLSTMYLQVQEKAKISEDTLTKICGSYIKAEFKTPKDLTMQQASAVIRWLDKWLANDKKVRAELEKAVKEAA